MTNRHYFINCRGADFLPSYESVWDKSGGVPIVNKLFNGQTQSMNSDTLIFNGSTRTATWLHFNKWDIQNQVKLLRGAGINLLRVHLDLYAWAGLGATLFTSRAKALARIAQDNKMYVQWVLFESDTYNDVSGKDALGRLHHNGGYDPSTLEQALTNGLYQNQRCPTVYASSFMTRHPSSMVLSGNAFLSSVINALSPYRSTLSWEVMSNVDFNTSKNPADVSAYSFLTSAIQKTRQLIPSNQKITTSFKYVTGDNTSPFYNSTQHSIYSSLDYICYNGANVGFIDRLVNYVDALSAAVNASTPLVVVNATLASHLSHLHTEVSAFSSLQIGFITDGIIDRNLGAKPFNNDRGIFFGNGAVRDIRYPESLKNRTLADWAKQGKTFESRRKKALNSVISPSYTQLSDYEADYVTNADKVPFDPDLMTRLSQMGDEGEDLYAYLRYLFYLLPELNTKYGEETTFNPLFTKYAPYSNSEGSKSLGYEIGNPNYNIDKNDVIKGNFISSELFNLINTYFSLGNIYSLSSSNFNSLNNLRPGLGDFARDRLAYFKINLLERIQKSLPVSSLVGSVNTITYPNLVRTTNNNSISSAYAPFAPSSPFKQSLSSVTPYIGNPRYLSGAAYNYAGYTDQNSYAAQFVKPFLEPLSACQKPVCYYIRGPGFASGSCYYKTGFQVNKDVTAIQNVLDLLDWQKYDLMLYEWALALTSGWTFSILNDRYKDYFLTVSGIIAKYFTDPEILKPNPYNIS